MYGIVLKKRNSPEHNPISSFKRSKQIQPKVVLMHLNLNRMGSHSSVAKGKTFKVVYRRVSYRIINKSVVEMISFKNVNGL